MVTIGNWAESLEKYFQDPLLSAQALRSLQGQGLVRLIREERDILAFAALLPTAQDMILAGVWASEQDDPRLTERVAAIAIDQALELKRAVIVPSAFAHYVKGTLTPKEAGRPLDRILEDMTHARIPRRHPFRHGGLMIVPPVVEERHAIAAQF